MYPHQKVFGAGSDVADMYRQLSPLLKQTTENRRDLANGGREDEDLPGNVTNLHSLRATHTFLSGGSIHVPDGFHQKFYTAYINDVLKDYEANFLASKGVPQNSASEFGHAEIFPLFFDIDLVDSAQPGETTQSMIGLIVMLFLSSLRQCFWQKSDEEWNKMGDMMVLQTLGRPKIRRESFMEFINGRRTRSPSHPPRRSPYSDSLSRSTSSLSSLSSGSQLTVPYHGGGGSVSLDGFGTGSTSPNRSSGSPNGSLALDESAMDGFGFGQARNQTSSSNPSSLGLDDERSNPMFMSSRMEAPSPPSPPQNRPPSRDEDEERLFPSADYRPMIVMRDQQNVLCSQPATTMVSPLILQTIPVDQRVEHHLGVNIVFPNILVNLEKAFAIREKVLNEFASFVATRQDLCDLSTLRLYNSKSASAPLRDMTVSKIRTVLENIVDPKVWQGGKPHKRMAMSHKPSDCVACGFAVATEEEPLSPEETDGNGGGKSKKRKSPSSGRSAAVGQGGRNVSGKRAIDGLPSSLYSEVDLIDEDSTRCFICGGSGVADNGPAAVSCMSYYVDGKGQTIKAFVDAGMCADAIEYKFEDRRKHYRHSYAHLAYPNRRDWNEDKFVQRRVLPNGMLTSIESLLARKPVEIGGFGDNKPIVISKLPRVLKRFPYFPDAKGRIMYIEFVVSRSSIRTRMESATIAQSVIDSRLASGLEPSLLDDSYQQGSNLAMSGMVHKLHLNRSRTIVEETSNSPDEIRSSSSPKKKDNLVCLNDVKTVTVLNATYTRDKLFAAIRACRREWSNLMFEQVFYLKSCNPLLKDDAPAPRGASAIQVSSMRYSGPCFIVCATGPGSKFCPIRQRCHTSRRCYYRFTPAGWHHTCASVSTDGGGENEGVPCYKTSGGFWMLTLALAQELFVGCKGVAKKMLDKLENRSVMATNVGRSMGGAFDGAEGLFASSSSSADGSLPVAATSESQDALEAMSRTALREAVSISASTGVPRAAAANGMNQSTGIVRQPSAGTNLGALLSSSALDDDDEDYSS
jgi:hypothetical protein